MVESRLDTILQEDIERVANSKLPWCEFEGSRILITGATGLIGSLLVKAFACRNRLHGQNINIIALVRNEEKARRVFAEIWDRPELYIIKNDIRDRINIDGNVDYIIHTASETASKTFVTHPVETINTALYGTANVLELAVKKHIKSMVYLSSLEVYGVTDAKLNTVTEADYGYIDVLNQRSSYSEGKRMAENMCAAYASEHNVPVKIARLSQTFGAGVDYEDMRVFAQFARSVIEKKDIILNTKGETERSYCYTSDALSAILYILIKGKQGNAYNVANKQMYISIKDMANKLAVKHPAAGIGVVFNIAEDMQALGYNPTVKINLDTKFLESLGWEPETGLDEAFDRLIKSMKIQQQNGAFS